MIKRVIKRVITESLPHFFVILSILFLTTACSPNHESIVTQQYNEAIAQGTIEDAISSLGILVKINSEQYSSKLAKAQKAKRLLDKALFDYQNGRYLEAYGGSHDAYRLFPTFHTKKILVSSGEALIFLLSVQSKLYDAYGMVPPTIYQQVDDYVTMPVIEWDLLGTNELINQLNTGAQLLQKSIDLLSSHNEFIDSPELIALTLDITRKKSSLESMKNTIINKALSESADLLMTINAELVSESITLYSILRPSVAKQNLYPTYLKANKAYLPYKILNENISLADAGQISDKHAVWYRNWSEIEDAVINIEHSEQASTSVIAEREKLLKEYRKGREASSEPKHATQKTADDLLARHKLVMSTFDKLTRDKSILHYGLPNR